MSTAQAAVEAEVVRVQRVYDAPPERVFRALTDPKVVGRWMGPPGSTCEVKEMDLRVGGRYTFTIHPPPGDAGCNGTGEASSAGGEYTLIDPHRTLAFTWSWVEGGMDVGETLVTFSLKDLGGRTELVLTHERLPGEEARIAHAQGWGESLERLAEGLA